MSCRPARPRPRSIVEHWRERWLTPRIKREDILQRIDKQRVNDFLLGQDAAAPARIPPVPADHARRRPCHRPSRRCHRDGDSTFVERLYRSTKSYADRLSQDEIEAIHVDLGVDGYLLEEAEAKSRSSSLATQVTARPTSSSACVRNLRHSALRSSPTLMPCSDEDTLDIWEQCRDENRPFMLAINEWPLYVLQRKAKVRSFAPVAGGLAPGSIGTVFRRRPQARATQGRVVTIDLACATCLCPASSSA